MPLQVRVGGPGLSEDEVAEDFELYDEALQSFLHQAGALKGFLQDALVGRAHLSENEGGSLGWSGAEVPKGFKQQACAADGFLKECMVGSRGWSEASVEQQASVVEDFLQQAFVLKRFLRAAIAGKKDLVEEAVFGAPGTSFGAPGAGCEWRAPPPLRLGLAVDTHCCTVGLRCHRACSVGSSPSGRWGGVGPG